MLQKYYIFYFSVNFNFLFYVIFLITIQYLVTHLQQDKKSHGKGRIAMKKTLKKNLMNILLTGALALGSSLTVMGGEIHGNVDEIQDNSISGWVWDAQSPDTPVTAAVFISDSTGTIVKQTITTADIQRDDVAANGYGSGACGFYLDMDWSQLPDGEYTVFIVADNQNIGGKHQYYKGQRKLRSLGVFKTTGYCPCRSCSSGWGALTSTGTVASANHTIAVDPRVIPYGTKVMINGVIYTAEDKGGGVNGKHVDIFYNTHGEARMQGVQYAEVFLLES